MTYGWLIMLVFIGVVNVIGRIAAKRAEGAGKGESGAAEPSLPSAAAAPPRVRVVRAAVPRTVQGEAVRRPSAPAVPKVEPKPMAAPAKPKVARADSKPDRAPAPTAVAPGARSPVPVASQGKLASRHRRPPISRAVRGMRWNASTLRQAFLAGEILGPPRAIRPVGGSAHEVH